MTIVVWFHRKLLEAITATEMVSMLRWMIFRYRSIKLERFQFVGRERKRRSLYHPIEGMALGRQQPLLSAALMAL
jgi:hypothetical protein